jgi:hypothetical protein
LWQSPSMWYLSTTSLGSLRTARHQHDWQTVSEGNEREPGWSPQAAHSIQELARKHAPEAIKRLAQIVETGDSHSAVVAAANTILDRAYGKPPQFNTSDATSFRKAVDMTDDELAAIAGRAKLTVV